MKLIRNAGSDRVIDQVRPGLASGNRLDIVTPALSLFAFAEMRTELAALAQCRMRLPPGGTELALLGAEADRAARNRLQAPWLAERLAEWLRDSTEVRRAAGPIPQGAFVLRNGDARPLQALLGSLAFSTDGLGLTPGNPMNLIQASETPEDIFQICALRDIQTQRERRQTIGRGLRLCVNQEGQRLRGFEVNTLTVIATESYEQFAENLQKEIEEDTGIRFGVVEAHQFAAVAVTDAEGKIAPLGFEQSKVLWEDLKAQGHIDSRGKVQDSLKKALKDGTLTVPEAFAPQLEQITHVLRKLAGRLEIKNADERRQVRPRQAVLHSPAFKALWDRIKHKTTYRVQFDNEKLVESCIDALSRAPAIPKTRLQWRKADIAIGKAGVEATEREGASTVVLEEADIELPDLLTDLQDRTQLTRRTIHRVLTGSLRLDDFRRNPQQFIELAAEAINRCKRLAVVDGIRYQRLGDDDYYAQELFEQEELTGYLKNMLDAAKSVYEQVVYDAGTEAAFADELEKNTAIKVYAKLPGWFTVPTPLGTYNPDWAVLVEKDGAERLYFVVETKSGLFTDDLRDKESAKIECGKAHFKALQAQEESATYIVARSIDDVLNATT